MSDFYGRPPMPARPGKLTKPGNDEPKNGAELLAVVWATGSPDMPETAWNCSTEAEREALIWWFLEGSQQKQWVKAAKSEYLTRGLFKLAAILGDFLAGKGPNEGVQAEVVKIQDMMDQHPDYVTSVRERSAPA